MRKLPCARRPGMTAKVALRSIVDPDTRARTMNVRRTAVPFVQNMEFAGDGTDSSSARPHPQWIFSATYWLNGRRRSATMAAALLLDPPPRLPEGPYG